MLVLSHVLNAMWCPFIKCVFDKVYVAFVCSSRETPSQGELPCETQESIARPPRPKGPRKLDTSHVVLSQHSCNGFYLVTYWCAEGPLVWPMYNGKMVEESTRLGASTVKFDIWLIIFSHFIEVIEQIVSFRICLIRGIYAWFRLIT